MQARPLSLLARCFGPSGQECFHFTEPLCSTSAISRWICYFRVTNLLYCILVQQDCPPSQLMQGEDGLLQFHSGPGPLSSRFWSRMQSREDSLLRGNQHTVDWYSRPTPQESSQRHRQTRCYCNNTACLNETLLPT